MSVPKPPAGLAGPGRRLWRAVLADFELAEHEVTMLREACYTADICSSLQERVLADGPLSADHLGRPVPHPALRELRQQRLTLARLVVCLRVPLGDEDSGDGRTQYRGIRGVYGGAAS